MGNALAQAHLITPRPFGSHYLLAMDIGDKIRRSRLDAGMTQRSLATALDVTQGLVAQWESHRKTPGAANLVAVARVLGVSIDYLTGISTSALAPMEVTKPDEIALLRSYRGQPPDRRAGILAVLGAKIPDAAD